MKKKGFLFLVTLLLTALLLAQTAFAECDLHWDTSQKKGYHRQYCRKCEIHKMSWVTSWEKHSYQLIGCSWPDKVDLVNGAMPETIPIQWDRYNTVRLCPVCGEKETITFTQLNATAYLQDRSTKVTCTTDGSYTYWNPGVTWTYATVDIEKTYTVKALGHDWSNKDGMCARAGCNEACAHDEAQKRLTCTEGTTCDVCGKPLSPLGHDWSNKDGTCARQGCGTTCAHTDAPVTCTEGADCDVCGKALAALGHDWSNKDGICARANCDEICTHEEAQKRVTCVDGTDCDVCGKTLEALGHDYKAKVTKPTCTTDGYTRYTCINCNDTYTADVVKKLSHWYGEWSPNADGTHTAACKRAKCRHTAERACQLFTYTLPAESSVDFTLCPVCGETDSDTRLALVEATAKAITKRLPAGEVVLRMGEAVTGDTLFSVGFEFDGKLTQPKGQVEITVPAELLAGHTLSLLSPDGTETDLPFTVSEEVASFILNFETQTEIPTMLLRLVPAA